MRLDYNQICTGNSEVETGKVYLYTEGKLECKVKVVQTGWQAEGVSLQLRVVALPPNSPLILGEEFQVCASSALQDTGRWYLHDQNLVLFPGELKPPPFPSFWKPLPFSAFLKPEWSRAYFY